jgi:hypothetical protein
MKAARFRKVFSALFFHLSVVLLSTCRLYSCTHLSCIVLVGASRAVLQGRSTCLADLSATCDNDVRCRHLLCNKLALAVLCRVLYVDPGPSQCQATISHGDYSMVLSRAYHFAELCMSQYSCALLLRFKQEEVNKASSTLITACEKLAEEEGRTTEEVMEVRMLVYFQPLLGGACAARFNVSGASTVSGLEIQGSTHSRMNIASGYSIMFSGQLFRLD